MSQAANSLNLKNILPSYCKHQQFDSEILKPRISVEEFKNPPSTESESAFPAAF